jgi:hypothetical protein
MFYLGANLLTRLVPDPDPVAPLLATAHRAASVIDQLSAG